MHLNPFFVKLCKTLNSLQISSQRREHDGRASDLAAETCKVTRLNDEVCHSGTRGGRVFADPRFFINFLVGGIECDARGID